MKQPKKLTRVQKEELKQAGKDPMDYVCVSDSKEKATYQMKDAKEMLTIEHIRTGGR